MSWDDTISVRATTEAGGRRLQIPLWAKLLCTLDVLGRGLYFDDVAARADIVVTWWRTRHHVHRDHHSHRNTCHNVARLDDQFCYSATETNRKTLQTRIDNYYQNELPFRKWYTGFEHLVYRFRALGGILNDESFLNTMERLASNREPNNWQSRIETARAIL